MSHPDATWADWYERHGRALVLLARQWCPTQADAEDAVQEAFMQFWPRRERVQDPAAYLYRCTRNAALDQRRAATRRRERQATTAAGHAELAREPSPAFQQHEDREQLEQALSQLPDDQRQVVVMKIWGGLTFAQIGTACAVSPNTAASRYRYGLAALRKALEPEYGDG